MSEYYCDVANCTLPEHGHKQLRIGHWTPAFNQRTSILMERQILADQAFCIDHKHHYERWDSASCSLVELRNAALERAINRGLDYLFMQDADNFSLMKGGALGPLLAASEETGATVTSALVLMRKEGLQPNVWPLDETQTAADLVGTIFECRKAGTGMVLLNLNEIRKWYDTGDYHGMCFREVFNERGTERTAGMDIWFSQVVRNHGGTIVCDSRIPTKHINAMHSYDYPDAELLASVTDMADPMVELTEQSLGELSA